MDEAGHQRLFVALWPDSEVRTRLSRIQTDLRLSDLGRVTPSHRFHITLLFLGDVPNSEVSRVKTFVESVQFEPFSVEINCIGSWPRNEVVWAGTESPSQELDNLAQVVREGLSGYRKNNKVFVPHITLARRIHKKLYVPVEPIRWQVSRIDLVRSILSSAGAHYESTVNSG